MNNSSRILRYDPIEIYFIFTTSGELTNGKYIKSTLPLLKKMLNTFETDARVTTFIEMTKARAVTTGFLSLEHNILTLHSESQDTYGRSSDEISYDMQNASMTGIKFTSRNMIACLNEFAPQLKDHLRIQEFLSTVSSVNSAEITLGNTRVVLSGFQAEIEYTLKTSQVHRYLLPNTIVFKSFPEIAQAHKIIQEQLLVDQHKDCVIGRVGKHNYTVCEWPSSEEYPLTVALICGNERRILAHATVRIRADGSYSRLTFSLL